MTLLKKDIHLVQQDHVRLDPEKRIFEHASAKGGPLFSTGEVAKVFGWKTAKYIRDLESEGALGIVQKDREGFTYRKYDLAEVELMAISLADHKRIDPDRLKNILTAVYSLAKVWKLI